MRTLSAISLFALLAGAQTQQRHEPAPEAPAATATPKPPAESPDEKPVVTHHKISLASGALSYTATTGFLPIKDDRSSLMGRKPVVAV